MNIQKWYGLPPDREYDRHTLSFKTAIAAVAVKYAAYLAALEGYIDLAANDTITGSYPLPRTIGFMALGFIAGEFGQHQLERCRLSKFDDKSLPIDNGATEVLENENNVAKPHNEEDDTQN